MDRYPEYKDSGIEWIGKIPKDWEVIRLASIGSFSKGSTISKGDLLQNAQDGHPCILYGELYTKFDRKVTATESQISYDLFKKSKTVNDGTFLFTASGETADEIGKCVLVKCNSLIAIGGDSTIYQLFEKEKFDIEYLSFTLNSEYCRTFKAANSRGEIVVHIYAQQLRNLQIACPGIQLQIAIRQHLDRKTTQIDSLIEKLEKKIELLKEYRIALISQCVTKGLDPDAEMKDSGIEWIGDIPKGWGLKRMKYLCSHISEKRLPIDGEVKISPEDVEAHTGKVANFYSEYETEGQVFCKGDVLFNKLRVYLNKVVLSELSGLSMGEMIVLRPSAIVNTYLYRVLSSQKFIDHADSISEGVKMPRSPVAGLLNSVLPCPPKVNQILITACLDQTTTKIDSLVEKLEKKIKLLKEYRQSLISNAVTGKIRVTEQAA